MKHVMTHKSWLSVAVAIALGAVLGWGILQRGKPAPEGDEHEHEAQEVRQVTLSDAQLQQAGIKLVAAGPALIDSPLPLRGEVHYNGDHTAQVVPRQGGLVQSVLVHVGDRVRQGQVLAVLSSASLADLRVEVGALQQRLTLAQATFEREKRLWAEKISPQQDYLQAQTALQEARVAAQGGLHKLASLGAGPVTTGDLTRFELRSPIDGVITEQHLSVGQSLGDSEVVFTISDLSSVWVDIAVSPKDLALLTVGQAAQVQGMAATIAGAPDMQAPGVIAYVSPVVAEQSRSALARIVLPNPKGWWRPGLPVQVRVTLAQTQVPVAVQTEAIQRLDDESVVFGRDGGELKAHAVVLGRSDGRVTEVLSGLNAGDRYAATNSFVIKAELGKAGASHEH